MFSEGVTSPHALLEYVSSALGFQSFGRAPYCHVFILSFTGDVMSEYIPLFIALLRAEGFIGFPLVYFVGDLCISACH